MSVCQRDCTLLAARYKSRDYLRDTQIMGAFSVILWGKEGIFLAVALSWCGVSSVFLRGEKGAGMGNVGV